MTRLQPRNWFLALTASCVLSAFPLTSRGAEPELKGGPGYDALATLPVMHRGRVKPLDTVARLEIKLIYGREQIKILDEKGNVAERWDPIAAFFDMTVRPDFWDDQQFILVDYVPLKAVIFSDQIEARLNAIAGRADAPEALKAAIAEAKKHLPVDAAGLNAVLKQPGLTDREKTGLAQFADRLGESSKWVSPRELEEARILIDGKRYSWESWANDVWMRASQANAPMIKKAAGLTDLEKRAKETNDRLLAYRVIRGDRDFARSTLANARSIKWFLDRILPPT